MNNRNVNVENPVEELYEELFSSDDILANQIEKALRTGVNVRVSKIVMRGYSDEYNMDISLSYLEMDFKTLKSKVNDKRTASKRIDAEDGSDSHKSRKVRNVRSRKRSNKLHV